MAHTEGVCKFPVGSNVLIAPLYSLDVGELNCFAKGQKECKFVVEQGKILNSIFPLSILVYPCKCRTALSGFLFGHVDLIKAGHKFPEFLARW